MSVASPRPRAPPPRGRAHPGARATPRARRRQAARRNRQAENHARRRRSTRVRRRFGSPVPATENRIEDFRDGTEHLGVVRRSRGDFPDASARTRAETARSAAVAAARRAARDDVTRRAPRRSRQRRSPLSLAPSREPPFRLARGLSASPAPKQTTRARDHAASPGRRTRDASGGDAQPTPRAAPRGGGARGGRGPQT